MSKNEKKILTQKWLLKLKNVRKPDRSRIKFYHMQPFKAQVLVYFDREITKIWFSSLSMFSNNWPFVSSAKSSSGDDTYFRPLFHATSERTHVPRRSFLIIGHL